QSSGPRSKALRPHRRCPGGVRSYNSLPRKRERARTSGRGGVCAANRRENEPVETPFEWDRWEKRFSVPEYVFGTEPNVFLKSQAALLPKSGKALAIADGEGRNGVWLAEQGLDVVSMDFSPAALAKAHALARQRGVSLRTIEADITKWE